MELCEHGNTYNCLQCEVKNLNYVIQELLEENKRLEAEKQELASRYAQRMNDCIRLKTQLSNRRKFKAL